jgi:hypothetical protein
MRQKARRMAHADPRTMQTDHRMIQPDPGTDGANRRPAPANGVLTLGPPGPNLTMRGDWNGSINYSPGEVGLLYCQNQMMLVSNAVDYATRDLPARRVAVVVLPPNLTVSDPPTQAELRAVANKVDELIAALSVEN